MHSKYLRYFVQIDWSVAERVPIVEPLGSVAAQSLGPAPVFPIAQMLVEFDEVTFRISRDQAGLAPLRWLRPLLSYSGLIELCQ